MSLVNDMLRDLEARRAGPGERPPLDHLYAVDDAGAARRERQQRLRRGAIFIASVCLIGALVGMMIGRVVIDLRGEPQPTLFPPAPAASVPSPAAPAVAPAAVLEVLPQHDEQRFVLQLLLDRSVAYQRSEENGAVSLLLEGVRLDGEPRKGRLQRGGSSLSWRVEPRGADLQVLLVGMGDQLEVNDRLESAGDRWQLWLEVPLTRTPPAAEVELDALPVAEPAVAEEAELPAWATRQVAPAEAPASKPAATAAPSLPIAAPKAAQMQVAGHRADALSQAREALQEQDYPRAIRELEALHRRQGRTACP